MHGFARTMDWAVDDVGDGAASLSLRDTPATRAVWPHAFVLRLRASFDGGRLTTHLDVENPAVVGAGVEGGGGADAWPFEALQHTYLYLGPAPTALGVARVWGLDGVKYTDKAQGGAAFVQQGDGFALEGEVDRVYCITRCVPPPPPPRPPASRRGAYGYGVREGMNGGRRGWTTATHRTAWVPALQRSGAVTLTPDTTPLHPIPTPPPYLPPSLLPQR